MYKMFFLAVIGLFIGVLGFANETPDAVLMNARNLYRQGRFSSSIQEGVRGVDLAFKDMLERVFVLIPELGGYWIAESNYNYTFSSESGYLEYFFRIEKVMSNRTAVIKMEFNNSLFELERLYHLFETFEHLSNRGNYEKLLFTHNRNEIGYLWADNTAYFPYVFERRGGEIVSGLMISVNFNYSSSVRDTERTRLTELYFQELFTKLNLRAIERILR
jgi:hypothetical protein